MTTVWLYIPAWAGSQERTRIVPWGPTYFYVDSRPIEWRLITRYYHRILSDTNNLVSGTNTKGVSPSKIPLAVDKVRLDDPSRGDHDEFADDCSRA